MRAERGRAQRDATRSPWREPAAPVAESGADAESRLLALHARHRRHLHVSGIEERLAASAEALAMAEASGSAEEAAYGHLWRIEALGQLGRRVELDGDQAGLRHAVRRLGQPVWEERLGSSGRRCSCRRAGSPTALPRSRRSGASSAWSCGPSAPLSLTSRTGLAAWFSTGAQVPR